MSLAHCPHCGCSLQKPAPLEYGNVRIDGLSDIVFKGRAVLLARTQRSVVEALIRARGRYLTRGSLATILGGEVYDQSICQYIRRARAAFRTIDGTFDQIENLHGFGAYKWRYCADRPAPDRFTLTVRGGSYRRGFATAAPPSPSATPPPSA